MKKHLIKIIITAVILLIPLVAMQFTDEVNWSYMDFLVASFLILTTIIVIELILKKVKNIKHRGLIIFAVLLLFLLIWAELAVGIFGTTFAGS